MLCAPPPPLACIHVHLPTHFTRNLSQPRAAAPLLVCVACFPPIVSGDGPLNRQSPWRPLLSSRAAAASRAQRHSGVPRVHHTPSQPTHRSTHVARLLPTPHPGAPGQILSCPVLSRAATSPACSIPLLHLADALQGRRYAGRRITNVGRGEGVWYCSSREVQARDWQTGVAHASSENRKAPGTQKHIPESSATPFLIQCALELVPAAAICGERRSARFMLMTFLRACPQATWRARVTI